MGEFLTEFMEALSHRAEELEVAFLKKDRRSGSKVAEWFRKRWIPDLPDEISPERVAAVDSSMEMKQYATGVNLIYARALAILFAGSSNLVARRFDVHPHTGANEEARNLSSRLAERLEHEVALDIMRREGGGKGVLLIDGSLSTRHVASIFNFRRHGWFSVEYIKAYSEMLKEAKERGWTLIAIAKSSRSIPMRDLALREIYASLRDSLPLDNAHRSMLNGAWSNAVTDPDEGVRISLNLIERMPNHRKELEDLAQLFYERHLYIADSDVIRRYVRGVGRTPAILVGAYTQSAQKMMMELERRKEEIAREIASGELARRRLAGKASEGLIDEAHQAIEEALNLPAYVAVYVRFREGDDPLKVEFPCWEVGKEVPWNSPYEELLEDSEEVRRILGMVRAGYAGPSFHNVWLERVDRKVKLRRGIVESIYERYLWRELGEVIPHARGERRVTRI